MKVETDDELSALPADTIIVDDEKWAWQRHTDPEDRRWIPAAFMSDELVADGAVPQLPVIVLWRPEV